MSQARSPRELPFISAMTLANAALAWAVFAVAGWDATGTELALRSTARVSLVYFLLAFVASPLDRLRPGRVGDTLLRYRRAIGVTFGLSMSIHVFCISRLFRLYAPATPPMVTLADFYIGIPGLVLVASMTVTSLVSLRRRLGPLRWGRLHRAGLWFVWAVFFLCLVDSVHRKASERPWLEYYPFIAALGLALALRGAAWRARRAHATVPRTSRGVRA
jgi:DMSO/TMAO reductase YedYZ heme-binding membrane subunit